MNVSWQDIFELPDAAYAGGRRIPKTVLTRRGMLTKREQRTLDKMARLEHFAAVSQGTTQILPRVDESYDIQSVILLRCVMAKDSQAVAEVAGILHKCFSNPTVLLQESDDSVAISVALTRRSHAERGATVVYQVESTGLFDPKDARHASFLDAIAFDQLPQGDLLSYLDALAVCVRLSRASEPLGFYPCCSLGDQEHLLELVSTYETQQRELDALNEQRRDKDTSPNESAHLRMQIRNVEHQRDRMIESIRELCAIPGKESDN